MQKTSIWGVVWWEDFHEEEGEALLPVLHLGSDWPSSPKATPYKCQAGLLSGCLRHRERGAGVTVGHPSSEPAGWKG